MNDLKTRIIQIIDAADGSHPDWIESCADLIVMHVRAHIASDDALDRACEAFNPPVGEVALWKVLKPCLLAAVGVAEPKVDPKPMTWVERLQRSIDDLSEPS